ncbi:MAG: Asp-tRNA(Asn)/Glu-tRNA(Gln) amidotransferase GatCAB subunit B, partial [Gammaproteobacteria bacterium]|nr:Asp-tRNA(Asn)/Glu-tRNA(Gln) amidotransferase GatCAB subunit B [Gammaproteobacteria bacterium]
KEEANDYRYFPDPDLLPVELSDELIERVSGSLPELPDAKRARFASEYGLSAADADQLTASIDVADYYEQVAKACGDAKLAANWMNVELTAALNKAGIEFDQSPVTAELLAGLLARITDNTISGKIAKQVFEAIWNGEGTADEVIEAKGLKQITDSGAIEAIVDEVIANNPQQVENYRNADESKQPKMLGFFVGQVMKASKGKANPQQVNQLLKEKL